MRRYIDCDNNFNQISQQKPYCWIDIPDPDQDDCRFLTEQMSMPQDFLEDIADRDELPRIETSGDWLLVIVRIPVRDSGDGTPFSTAPLGLVIHKNTMVSIHYNEYSFIDDTLLILRRKGIKIRNHIDLALHIIFSSTDWFLKYLRQINFSVETAEKKLGSSIENSDLIQLRDIQKTLVYFNTAIRGNQVMTDRLKSLYQEKDSLDVELLEDLVIELKQAFNTVNVYTEILNATMDSYTSIISNNLNVIMKRMTSFSIALMIPTLIASFYGMNVRNGSESAPLAFIAIISVSILMSVACLAWFRKIRWF